MKNLLEFLLIHIVTFPEDVRVEETETDRGTVFTLYVHPDDMGRVIGKNGAVIESIRKIAKVRAVKEGIRANIVLADPQKDAAQASESVEVIAEADEAGEFEAAA